MAEVLEPDPATAERGAVQAVETPGWTAPEDADPQVGASRGRGRSGAGRSAPEDLQWDRRVPQI